MNRIEIIATFTALRELSKCKNYEGIDIVIEEVLKEAKGKSKDAEDQKAAD